jgi:putative lipoic acid-binding regulatory protein
MASVEPVGGTMGQVPAVFEAGSSAGLAGLDEICLQGVGVVVGDKCIMSDHRPSAELLESSHEFPGVFQFKAIGAAGDDFTRWVVEAVIAELATASDLKYSVRTTPGGRHVSLTLDVTVQSAEQVRAIYGRLHAVEGMILLL